MSRLFLSIALLAGLVGCVSTQVRQAKDTAGNPIPVTGTVVLVEPDIELYELGAGGMQEPRKEWTESARREFPAAARQILGAQGIQLRPDFHLPPMIGTLSNHRSN
jgi:hypothetical protein